jgi:hypothetical protein
MICQQRARGAPKAWPGPLVVLFCAVSLTSLLHAQVVTFDAAVAVNANGFQTQGYTFDIASNHYHLESANLRFGMTTPTTSLIIDDFGGANSLTITSDTTAVFDLLSLDIASRSVSHGSTTVTITGNLSGGGMVNHIYNDNNDSTFENLVLNWGSLISVHFAGSGNPGDGENWFRLDDVSLLVPEPASLMLFGLSVVGLAVVRARRSTG